MSDEYFIEWNSGHNVVIYIYKKIRPINADDLANGQMLNYEIPTWKEIALDEYKKYWFVVDVIYSFIDIDFQAPIVA